MKIRMPDLMESIFEICYLAFDLIASIIFFLCANGNQLFILYGCLALVLGLGDAFHLVPRVIRALKGADDRVNYWLGRGLQISSITMTIFYVMYIYIWQLTFPDLKAPLWITALIWVTALIRIIICLFPQNNWINGNSNRNLSLARNLVFLLTGIGVIILYVISGDTNGYHLYLMVPAIIISFACYFPVTLWSKKNPKIGMLMLPKTCAYIWMICMGLALIN